MVTITYKMIRDAMDGEPYFMTLTSSDASVVVEAVNQGIDAHLEACNSPDRGDRYEPEETIVGGEVLCRTLACVVSVESFPTLLRRLWEMGEAEELLADIFFTLEIDVEADCYEIISPVDEADGTS